MQRSYGSRWREEAGFASVAGGGPGQFIGAKLCRRWFARDTGGRNGPSVGAAAAVETNIDVSVCAESCKFEKAVASGVVYFEFCHRLGSACSRPSLDAVEVVVVGVRLGLLQRGTVRCWEVDVVRGSE
jgi:hypothetical protein